jgi:hypothetical protein
VATDLSRSHDSGSGPNHRSTREQPERNGDVAPSSGASARQAPAKKTTAAKKATAAKQTTAAKKANAAKSAAVVLRRDKPPTDRLDFDDRHDTRATENPEAAKLYAELRRQKRRDDWHRLSMGLVATVVLTAAYLAGFVLLVTAVKALNPWQAAQIVGLAFPAAGGGLAGLAGARALTQGYRRRRGRGAGST